MDKTLPDLKEQAAQLMGKRKYQEAIKLLLEAHNQAPDDDRLSLRIADAYRGMGRVKEAVECYKSVADRYSSQGMFLHAIAVNRTILDLAPDDREIHNRLAILFAKRASNTAAEMKRQVMSGLPVTMAETGADGGGPMEEMEIIMDMEAEEGTAQPPAIPPMTDETPITAVIRPRPRQDRVKLEDLDVASIDLDTMDMEMVILDDTQILPNIPLLSDLEAPEVDRLLRRVEYRRIHKGEFVCYEGESGSSLFIIIEGSVSIFASDQANNTIWVANLGAGDFFGEFGLFAGGKRYASVAAAEDTELLEISKEVFDDLAGEYPRVRLVLLNFYKRRIIDTLLAKSSLFQGLDAPVRARLVDSCAIDELGENQTVLGEGDQGGLFYLIKSGRIEASVGHGANPIVLGHLGPGEFFGDLTQEYRSEAAYRTVERSELVVFFGGLLVEMSRTYPEIGRVIQRYRDARVHRFIERLTHAGMV